MDGAAQMRQRWSESELQSLIERWKQGASLRSLAAEAQVSVPRLSALFRKSGVSIGTIPVAEFRKRCRASRLAWSFVLTQAAPELATRKHLSVKEARFFAYLLAAHPVSALILTRELPGSPAPSYATIARAAEIAGVNPATIRTRILESAVVWKKLGGRYVIRVDSLDQIFRPRVVNSPERRALLLAEAANLSALELSRKYSLSYATAKYYRWAARVSC